MTAAPPDGHVRITVDGTVVDVVDDGAPLSEVLRDRLGLTAVKDGCSPQGQCGCCTVLVDGQPRVSCVTPLRRVAGRSITTIDGLNDADRNAWCDAFVATGGSQCGFCTPGIIMRFEGLLRQHPDADADRIDRALAAHLCRCTGWQTIVDAWHHRADGGDAVGRDDEATQAAERRASLEAGVPQRVGPAVAAGRGGFADDSAPVDAPVAVRSSTGEWFTAPTQIAARNAAGKVQGRRTTAVGGAPIDLPEGEWARTLQTSWVDGGYLEPDASWCAPGGEPVSPRSNGGGFGHKAGSLVTDVARRLADADGEPVRVRYAREDVVRMSAKRPPLAVGLRADGSGTLRIARTDGVAEMVATHFPRVHVEEVDVAGPPTAMSPRGSVWLELAVVTASLVEDSSPVFAAPGNGTARVEVLDDRVIVTVGAGDPLDDIVLRSYVIGAVHMGWSLATSESITVVDGEPIDLTVRSLGVLPSGALPPVEVVIESRSGEPVPVGTSVMAASAHAAWAHSGWDRQWPTARGKLAR